MNGRAVRLALAFLTTLCWAVSAVAVDQKVLFVNGIQNTPQQALINLKRLQNAVDPNFVRQTIKRSFIIEAIYNPIGYYGGTEPEDSPFKHDLREVFLLKTAEELYGPSYRQIVSPHYVASPIDLAAAGAVAAYYKNMLPSRAAGVVPANNYLERTGEVSASNMQPTRAVITKLVEKVGFNLGPTIVVAHSQGNLLANLAYAVLANDLGRDLFKRVRVINVANTAEFAPSGLDFTHEDDLVLQGEKQLAIVARWPRTTPKCMNYALCEFSLASPQFGGGQFANFDFLHHAFDDVYLSLAPLQRVPQGIGVRFGLYPYYFVDRFVDLMYAAADSLDSSDIYSHAADISVGAYRVVELVNQNSVRNRGWPAPSSFWTISNPDVAQFDDPAKCVMFYECRIIGISPGKAVISFFNGATLRTSTLEITVLPPANVSIDTIDCKFWLSSGYWENRLTFTAHASGPTGAAAVPNWYTQSGKVSCGGWTAKKLGFYPRCVRMPGDPISTTLSGEAVGVPGNPVNRRMVGMGLGLEGDGLGDLPYTSANAECHY